MTELFPKTLKTYYLKHAEHIIQTISIKKIGNVFLYYHEETSYYDGETIVRYFPTKEDIEEAIKATIKYWKRDFIDKYYIPNLENHYSIYSIKEIDHEKKKQ